MKKTEKKAGKAVGCIYILTNPSFSEYVKIGYASDLESRLHQLNSSPAVPFAFRAYAIYEVQKPLSDKELHKLIDKLNPNIRTIDDFNNKKRRREFYAMSKEDAYSILESIARISGTEDRLRRVKADGHELEDERTAREIKETARRGPFSFKDCGIPVGAELVYVGNPAVVVTVLDDRHVQYGKETTSLSGLAQRLRGYDHPTQGPLHFKYKGETLDALRRRLGK